MTDNFKLLSDAEHIRKRFSMYGGSQVVQEEVSFINTEFKKVNIVGGLLKVISHDVPLFCIIYVLYSHIMKMSRFT